MRRSGRSGSRCPKPISTTWPTGWRVPAGRTRLWSGGNYDTSLGYSRSTATCRYGFDWRKQETELNRFGAVLAVIGGFRVHFVHERGKGSHPMPILLLHGWPDSFYRFHKIIPMLTDPARFGGDPADSFDVVVPSLPGFGFSERPRERGWGQERDAALFHTANDEGPRLERYGAHGRDGGSLISQALSRSHAESVVGIHITDIGYDKAAQLDSYTLSEAEKRVYGGPGELVVRGGRVRHDPGVQAPEPRLRAKRFSAGLAAWIVEKFRAWSDCGGDVERSYSKTRCSPT